MRPVLLAALLTIATPALAQFPPPGVYTCATEGGDRLGVLSLLVAGDYQWDPPDGKSAMGQVASAGNGVEALSGPLAEAHWKGSFSLEMGEAVFVFDSDGGKAVCRLPPLQ
jgi:hypothetical protein